ISAIPCPGRYPSAIGILSPAGLVPQALHLAVGGMAGQGGRQRHGDHLGQGLIIFASLKLTQPTADRRRLPRWSWPWPLAGSPGGCVRRAPPPYRTLCFGR